VSLSEHVGDQSHTLTRVDWDTGPASTGWGGPTPARWPPCAAAKTSQLLDDLEVADRKVAEATRQAVGLWRRAYGPDELLTSVSGVGPVTAPAIRALPG
jgi:hypothetical protein